MRTIIRRILVVLFCLMIMPVSVYADNAGGTGSGGGASGNTGSGNNWSSDFYWQSGDDDAVRVAAYRFDLVYKPKNGDRYIIKTVIAQDNSSNYAGSWCVSSGRQFLIQRVKEYTDAVNQTGESLYGATYVDSGPLVDLVRRLSNGETIDNIFNQNAIEDEELIKEYITSSLGFNLDEDEMLLEQDDNPGTYDSYGYRILIQKIQVYATGNSSACPTFFKFAATRKDVASNSAVKQILAGDKTVYIAPYSLANGIASDLWTTKDDIGISNGYPYRFIGTETGQQIRNKAQYFADWNNGLGYNILWFSTSVFTDYDYSVDAACVNCNSDDEDNTAYIIQDTTDWEAIFASKNSSNSNVVGYYDKGNGVYCREEYTVYFPNANNTIYVEPGRYFTLNASASALESVTSSSAIPNLKPIKVVKKRQCRVNSEENSSNATTVLNTFRANSEYDFKAKTGTVYFKYTEDYDGSRYSMTEAEELEAYDEDDNYTYSISDGTLTMEITKYYTLPENYYQYIRKQDGLSMKTKPSTDLSYYINVGISNLPVSFNNTGGEESGSAYKAADIQFSYELPGNNNDTDQYSLLYKAYIKDNSYLAVDSSTTKNIYYKYINNEMEDGDETILNNSACAKMYGVGTTGFTTCAEQRVNNSIGEGSNSCIVKNEIGSSSTSGYSCVVLTYGDDGGGDDDCLTEEDAESLGLDWDPYHQVCCPAGTTYNSKLGKCETTTRVPPDDDEDDYVCEIKDGKYYDFYGNEITKDEYDEICPADIPPICDSGCEYGCCPSGECAPMPGGVCPGSGGIDVVYRTIDLTYPFPGQNAEQRSTGTNWCSYDIQTQQIDCAYNNQTVTTYITDNTVYDDSHVLYEVTLDTETINSIRSYNNSHAYDDWDLECLDNGQACISEFLRSVVDTTGNCANATKSTFYTCDD